MVPLRPFGAFILLSTAILCMAQTSSDTLAREPIGCDTPPIIHSGAATFYNQADGSGSCCFPATPGDLMVAALSLPDYDKGYACGSCIEITGPDSVIVIRVVDQCPGCKVGEIDLSRLAFSKIAPLRRGHVPISWRFTDCPVEGPIVYHFKTGSSRWWTAVQVRNHRYPILRLEYQDTSGQFVDVPRKEYSYFVKKGGMGPGPYTFRVTDLYGHSLIDSGVVHKANGDVPGAGQFPRCD